MTLAHCVEGWEILGKQTKLSSAGSSSEWWSQRMVPVRVVTAAPTPRQRHSEHDRGHESCTLFVHVYVACGLWCAVRWYSDAARSCGASGT
eukprot:4837059-Prymnesium_polylepis.1